MWKWLHFNGKVGVQKQDVKDEQEEEKKTADQGGFQEAGYLDNWNSEWVFLCGLGFYIADSYQDNSMSLLLITGLHNKCFPSLKELLSAKLHPSFTKKWLMS